MLFHCTLLPLKATLLFCLCDKPNRNYFLPSSAQQGDPIPEGLREAALFMTAKSLYAAPFGHEAVFPASVWQTNKSETFICKTGELVPV